MTRIKKSTLCLYALLISILQPDLITQYRFIFYLMSVVTLLVFLCLFARVVKTNSFSPILNGWFFVRLYLLMVMAFNGNFSDIDKWGRVTLLVANFIMILDVNVRHGKTKVFLNAVSNLSLCYLVINLLSFLVFPKGLVQTIGGNIYFLGSRNGFASMIFFFILSAGLNYLYYGSKIPFYFTVIIGIFTVIYFNVSTAIVGFLVVLVLIVFNKVFKRFLSIKNVIIVSTSLNLAFVFLNASSWFSWFIEQFLKKDLTLTNRMYIWANAITMIFDAPLKWLYGHGIVNDSLFVYMYGLNWHAHNQLLQWLFEVGILGIVFTYLFFLLLDRHNKLEKDSYFARAICAAILMECITSVQFIGFGAYACFCYLYFLNGFRESIKA